MLIVKVADKTITLTEKDYFIRGTVGAKCQVIFDDCWDNYIKTIVFKHASSQIEPINLIVQSKFEEITIPWEILHTSGVFKIGFYATAENEVFPTLWSELIEIRGGTATDGVSPSKYTPNEIEQLKVQKQDKLTPGSGIVIKDNVISSVGGGGSSGIVDTTYNPESYNAQSGVGLAPVLQKKLELWQPNTEYKVGDSVLSYYKRIYPIPNYPNNTEEYTIAMVCIKDHTSPDTYYPTDADDFYNCWQSVELDAYRSIQAIEDGKGNDITKTYATKDELSKKPDLKDILTDNNFKTINGESILGSGNIDIKGGSGESGGGEETLTVDYQILATGIIAAGTPKGTLTDTGINLGELKKWKVWGFDFSCNGKPGTMSFGIAGGAFSMQLSSSSKACLMILNKIQDFLYSIQTVETDTYSYGATFQELKKFDEAGVIGGNWGNFGGYATSGHGMIDFSKRYGNNFTDDKTFTIYNRTAEPDADISWKLVGIVREG